MARTIGIGHQNFEELIKNHYFYIDKNLFYQGMVGKWRCCDPDYTPAQIR